MSGRYLLDTSVIIELFAGDRNVIEQLEKSESIFIPSIAIGELHYGARNSTRVKNNLDQIDQLVNTGVVIPCNEVTGYWYGIVKDKLRRKGHPIPENDIWIAALAIQYGLSLATRDKHFLIIENLKVVMW